MSYYIKIGTVELTKFAVESGVSGLSMPSIRTSTGNYSGTDGGYIDGQFFSTRTVVITGVIRGNGSVDLCTKKRTLIDSLPIRTLLPVYIQNDDGTNYIMYAYMTDFKMDLVAGTISEFQITLTAPDPYIYDNGNGSGDEYITRTINKIVGGGYLVPMIFPYIYEAGTTPTVITNATNIYIYPIIELVGKFTNPKITNVVTGDFIKVTASTSLTDTIRIDTRLKTVTLNGGSILPSMSGTWINIAPGSNTFKLDTDSNDDTTSCTMKYRLGYLGI